MVWLQTASGKAFDLLRPNSANVDFADIALALSKLCRFGGHCTPFYSVAEHCVRVSQALPQYKLYGLLHDAHEAYIGDITTPVHKTLAAMYVDEYDVTPDPIKSLKDRVDAAIYEAAGVPPLSGHPAQGLVKWADVMLCETERRDLMAAPPKSWGDTFERIEPLPGQIRPWSPAAAAEAWLGTFKHLMQQKAA